MDLYKELKLKPVRSEPNVWVSRLVTLERLSPEPVIIRDVALTRGLNIVWAEEPEDDASAAEICGHSAGKTTFCRFLRYVLGENTFGTKVATELMRKAIPEGYVAAEIHVGGKKWAVRRPFGGGRMTYIKQDATIEEMLRERTAAVSQEDYPKRLGLEGLLDEFETGQIVQTAEDIQWTHVLAWCTRDQEARFQNIHDWRSPRSESDTPSFRFPKAGPLFVMRTVLGLFQPDELKGEERLAELLREKERLTKEIEDKRREPQFRVNLYDHELRRRLGAILLDEHGLADRPLHSDELLPDLHRLTDHAISVLEEQSRDHAGAIVGLQDQIDNIGGRIRERESELQQLDALFDLNVAAGKELDTGLSGRQEQRKQLQEHQDKMCPFGGVLIRECSYVTDRQNTLRITELQDVHAMEQAEARREEEKRRIETAKSGLRASIEELRRQRGDLQAKRESLEAALRKDERETHELRRARESLETWTQRRDQGAGYEELVSLRQKLDGMNHQIEEIEQELTGLLRQHDENRERLGAIFSAVVRSVLSSDGYDGAVSLDNRELAFRVTHGPAMSGEAVETLSVLLADVASLIYHTVSDKSRLPGFLVHDSPREADLGIRIYRSFIRFAASLQAHFGGSEKCPFQYILTTTTAPPDELRSSEFLKLRLSADKPEGLLLGRNVAVSSTRDEMDLFQGARGDQDVQKAKETRER